MKKQFDHKKFTFKEIFINEDGKTSCSGFVGGMAGFAGIIGFIFSFIGWTLELKNAIQFNESSLEMLGISALLLGVRKGISGYIQKRKEKR